MVIQSIETRWRYVLALAGGLLAGGYTGSMLATIYVVIARKESLSTLDPLAPYFLRYSWANLESTPSILQSALIITAAIAFALTLVGVAGVYRGSLTQYDDAHFQNKREIKRNRMLGGFGVNGFVYGKLGRPNSGKPFVSADPDRFPHAVMVAPTGRGKGVGFVIPNLLHFDGSGVVLDVKGENFKKTAIHRQKGLGNRIWYFSPFDYVDMPAIEGMPDGGRVTRTHRFNPLERIAQMASTDERYTALNTLADLFLVVEGDNARGFYQAGKRLFIASCLFAIEQGQPNLGYASEVMGGGGNRADNYRKYAELTVIPVVARTFNEMAGETQKIVDSYISVINGAGFELWSDPSVVRATSESDFDFSAFRREKQTLYIAVQAEHLKTLAPLIRLLFADAIASLQKSEPGPDEPNNVTFLMDEFDQLGRQPLVLQSIKTIRSFGGRFFIITQSIAGLDSPSLYGEADRRSLLAGAGIQIYMTPQDDKTAEVLSQGLGKRTITSISESQSRVRELDESANISRRSEERPLLSASELLRFPLDKVLILPEGQYPIKADHIRYYEDQYFEPIDAARKTYLLPYPPLEHERKMKRVAGLSNLAGKPGAQHTGEQTAEQKVEAAENGTDVFRGISAAAKKHARRRAPCLKEVRKTSENAPAEAAARVTAIGEKLEDHADDAATS